MRSYIYGQSMSLVLSMTAEFVIEYMMAKRGTVQFSRIFFCSYCLEGDVTVSHLERWPEAIILVTTTISIYTMQSESVHRYWSMSRKLEALQQASPSRISIPPRCTNILVTIGVVSSTLVSVGTNVEFLFLALSVLTAGWSHIQLSRIRTQ